MISLYGDGKSLFTFALPALFTRVWTYNGSVNNNNNDGRNFLSRNVKSSVCQTTNTTETKLKNKKQ
jgi:hypothetical protein